MNERCLMEEKSLFLLKIYRILSLASVAGLVLVRIFALIFFYEDGIGYYRVGAFLPTVLWGLFLLSGVGFAILSLRMSKHCVPIPHTNSVTAIAALVVGIVFAATALIRYCSRSASAMGLSTVFAFITGGLAAVYFILLAFRKLSPALAILTGLGTILWLSCLLLQSYFDLTVAMNSPEKLAVHLAATGGMLLMLAEMRLACGAPKKRFYLFSLALGTLSLCVASLPTIIASLADKIGARDLSYADFAFLALGLFGTVRLIGDFHFVKEPPEAAESNETDRTPDDTDTPDCE